MNTITLWRLASSDSKIKRTFGGVFPSDDLPVCIANRKSFIINLDEKNKPGSHWVSVFFTEKTCFYYDSYGMKPTKAKIIKFIKRNSKNCYWNDIVHQSLYSTTCGYFCLYFLYKMNRNQCLNELSTTDKFYNDEFVKKFVKNHFYLAHPSAIMYNQCCTSMKNNKII